MRAATAGQPTAPITAAAIAAASQGRLLTAAEEQTLGRLMRQGDQEARELLILKNDGLVWSIVHRYGGTHLSDDDLHSYGIIGLLRAVQDWDPELGYKFSTYAHNWIRQAIGRALHDYDRAIRLPVHMNDRLAKLNAVQARLTQELGRRPTEAEIARAAGISREQLATAREAAIVGTPASLEASATALPNEDRSLIDVLADPTADDPLEQLEAAADASMRRDLLAQLLTTISPRLAEILHLRYGLDGGAPRTLAEVGELMSLTRERVRQLEAEALQQIRRSTPFRQLATAAD